MKSRFESFFPPSQSDLEYLWGNALLIFDANVILNFYRYSNETRDDFVRVMEGVRDRIWLPEQVAFEFLNNRVNVVKKQVLAYESAISAVDKLQKDFSGHHAHPFVSRDVLENFKESVLAVKNELNSNLGAQKKLFNSDAVRDQVAGLFEGRIGDSISSQEMEGIFAEGADRYARKVPPGYKDGGKHSDPQTYEEKLSNFGDLVVWTQILRKVGEGAEYVIFVTDDQKEDWWEKEAGIFLGPRRELIEEFLTAGGKKIIFSTSENFLGKVLSGQGAGASQKAIQEVAAQAEVRPTKFSRPKVEVFPRFKFSDHIFGLGETKNFRDFVGGEDASLVESDSVTSDGRMNELGRLKAKIQSASFRRDMCVLSLRNLAEERDDAARRLREILDARPEGDVEIIELKRRLDAIEKQAGDKINLLEELQAQLVSLERNYMTNFVSRD